MWDMYRAVFNFANSVKRAALSKRLIATRLKSTDPIYLEFGAGEKKGVNGWITMDITSTCDVFCDVRDGIPFPNMSISKIYSSHFLEHLTFEQCTEFLSECRRVLQPGGHFSVCVPNSRIYIEAYYLDRYLDPEVFLKYKPAFNDTTKIDYINHIAYMNGQHKYMFDERNLVHILNSTGFKMVQLREFDPSTDLLARDVNSIYATAVN